LKINNLRYIIRSNKAFPEAIVPASRGGTSLPQKNFKGTGAALTDMAGAAHGPGQ